jgi:ATP-dependent Clp protease ATP-binding subunit ClpC
VEKAHPDVFNVLLQLLEDGRLTDGHGRTVDFKNVVVIMTSNLGTEEFQREGIGFGHRDEADEEKMKKNVESALKRTFRPELLNRIDDVIVFHPLTEEHLKSIVDLLIRDTEQRLAERGIKVEISDEAKAWLARAGYDPVYGARPLRRAIEKHVDNPLSTKILQNEFKEGDTVRIGVQDDGLVFSIAASGDAKA